VWSRALRESNLDTKTLRLGGEVLTIAGLSVDDPYFAHISDDFEPDFIQLCEEFIGDDYVCLDIGANIGLKSLILAHYVERGKVIAVEPSPTVALVLERNVVASGKSNLRFVRLAVGDHEGVVNFVDNSAYGHIAEDGIPVRVTTLSELVQWLGLDRLDFVKLDVEGYEFHILRNQVDLLTKHRSLVLLEFNSWCQLAFADCNPREFAEWLLQNFSHVFMLHKGGSSGELLRRIEPGGALHLLHTNMVHHGTLTDILVTNAPERLNPTGRRRGGAG
jgi:FkbM family methyltransferase